MADRREPTSASDGPAPRARRSGGGSSGRRQQARAAQRRRQRRRRTLVVGGLLLVAAGTAVAVAGVGDALVASVRSAFERPDDDPPSGSELGDTTDHLDDEVELTAAVLVLPSVDDVSDVGDEPGAGLQSVAVLADAAGTSTGTMVLLPPSLTVDLDDGGSTTLAEAYRTQGSPLVLRAVAVLLGLEPDGSATIPPAGWEALGAELDGLEVDVRRPIEGTTPDGRVVRFDAGEQRFDGQQVRRYLTLDVPGARQLDVLPRTQVVLDGVLDAVDADAAASEVALEDAVAAFHGELDIDRFHALLSRLAADRDEPPTILTVPVQATGSEDEPEGYRLDEDRVGPVLDRLVAWQDATQVAGRRLRVLNGNGVPGIGPRIAMQLEEAGFRPLLTGNADRFTYERTRILVHGEDDEARDAAREVQEVLGTGTIERSGVVEAPIDLTIVVGEDLAPEADDRTEGDGGARPCHSCGSLHGNAQRSGRGRARYRRCRRPGGRCRRRGRRRACDRPGDPGCCGSPRGRRPVPGRHDRE